MAWWPVLGSSAVLSLALLGDALLYAVLPLHATAFGVSLVWVGVLLSANRFVRVLVYGGVAKLAERLGSRRLCVIAALTAAISTMLYGLGRGEAVLLLARCLWGLSYASLLLVTLDYSMRYRARAGTRVGLSRTVQRVGPVVALVGGSALVAVLGPRETFVLLGALSLLAVPIALLLPAVREAPVSAAGDAVREPTAAATRVAGHGRARQAFRSLLSSALGRPRSIDLVFFWAGVGVDGVFSVSITLMLAERMDLAAAVFSGGLLHALRHFSEAAAAPLLGIAADRLGASRVFLFSVALIATGMLAVSVSVLVAGSVLLLIGRGAIASVGPAVIAQATDERDSTLHAVARMQAWRDLGAALGPLLTGVLLGGPLSPQALHALVGAALLVSLVLWYLRR
ncbi:MAG: MFS transporter [Gammaproteobacteria bacterium]|nr:MFS transporter [Gammaproteobacteria bacterium]